MVQMVVSQHPPDPPPQLTGVEGTLGPHGFTAVTSDPTTAVTSEPPAVNPPLPSTCVSMPPDFLLATAISTPTLNNDHSDMSQLSSHSHLRPEQTSCTLVSETNPFLPQPPPCDALNSHSSPLSHDATQFLPDVMTGANATLYSDSFQPITDNSQTRFCDLPPADPCLMKDMSWNLDNAQQYCLGDADKLVHPNPGADSQCSGVEYADRTQRVRRDSSESTETVSSTGETFSSAYTDTVSSVNSTDFLIRPDESDEETGAVKPVEAVQEIYYNNGYASYSSSEMLCTDKESEDEESAGEQGGGKSEQPLLGEGEESSGSQTEVSPDDDIAGEETDKEKTALDDFVPHSLIPITEHEELQSFLGEEVEPTMYTKITNNITVVDESFLFESQTSLGESETPKHSRRAGTMQNLHERLSFLDLTEISKVGRACQKALIYLKDDLTFGSLASLNNMANKGFDKDPGQGVSLIDGGKVLDVVPSSRHTRNLVAMSLVITLLFTAIGSVRNLQSSINHEGGVGVISMAVTFAGYMIGSVFSVSVVQNFQPRTSIIINLIPNLLYVAANIYPTLWIMAPISFIQGWSTAILWNAMSTYVTFLARGRAQKKNESFEIVSGRFFGIFCLIYQSYLIVGNLIASLVLMFGKTPDPLAQNATAANSSLVIAQAFNHSQNLSYGAEAPTSLSADVNSRLPPLPSNLTLKDVTHLHLCGAEYCQHFDLEGSAFSVSVETKYVLFGIYMGCIVLAILIAMFILEPLNVRLFSPNTSRLQKTKSQLLSLVKFSVNRKFLLLLPISMYSVMQFGFVSAEVTKAFVTCPLGIHMVGYTMICLGVCGSVSSYLSGLLTKYTGRTSLILTAATLNFGALTFMSVWHPTLDSLAPYFALMGVWGVSDGIWISQVNSLMGVVFPDKYEEAFAGLRVAQGLGLAFSFGYSNTLCMQHKIYIIGCICLLSVVGYLVMEGILRRSSRQKPVLLKQTSV
ncbi:uncharacterized protein LOC101856043 [Aplysia californica]|uniref:Uncharacterized protein LOC101856043 n=1 Tax=Aplysia californica TaxID=6500 RepID=A0ABM0K032_APLCA|nr:uncharacterized protein LOC101856043 [Aplysia californica]